MTAFLMQYMRTFVAVEISQEVQSRAANLANLLRDSGVKASWTKLGNMHLTLKFLGDTPETLLPDVCRAVLQAGRKVEPFELHFTGVGAFPGPHRPQILWLGIEEGKDELQELFQAVEESLFALRYPKERGRFTPHLTLGRVRGGGPQETEQLQRRMEEQAHYDAGISVVDEVIVFSSILDRTNGPTYVPLARCNLG